MNKTLSFTNKEVLNKLKQIQDSKEITMSQYITNLILQDIRTEQNKCEVIKKEEIIKIIQEYLSGNEQIDINQNNNSYNTTSYNVTDSDINDIILSTLDL